MVAVRLAEDLLRTIFLEKSNTSHNEWRRVNKRICTFHSAFCLLPPSHHVHHFLQWPMSNQIQRSCTFSWFDLNQLYFFLFCMCTITSDLTALATVFLSIMKTDAANVHAFCNSKNWWKYVYGMDSYEWWCWFQITEQDLLTAHIIVKHNWVSISTQHRISFLLVVWKTYY